MKFGRKILEKIFTDEGFELTDKAIEEVAKKLRLGQGGRCVMPRSAAARCAAHEVLQAVYPEIKRDPERLKQAALDEPPSTQKSISIRGLTEGIAYKLGAMLPSAAGRPHRRA